MIREEQTCSFVKTILMRIKSRTYPESDYSSRISGQSVFCPVHSYPRPLRTNVGPNLFFRTVGRYRYLRIFHGLSHVDGCWSVPCSAADTLLAGPKIYLR